MIQFCLSAYALIALAVAIGTLNAGRADDQIADVAMLAVIAGTFWPVTLTLATIAWVQIIRAERKCEPWMTLY